MTNRQAIKTAIVGYGFSAKTFHIPFLVTLPEFQFSAISSSQEALVQKEFPSLSCYETAEAMIEHCDAELVVITAPNDVHFPLAKLALQNNKHVLIEKPFVTEVTQGEELITLAKQKNRVLCAFHNRRWDGDFLTVQKLVQENTLGDIRYFESHFDRFRPNVRQRWRETAPDGGGILFDLGPHLLDQVLQLFGLPSAIEAQCKALREGSALTDFFHLSLHYPDKLVVLHSSPFCAGPNVRFQVQGERCTYVKSGLDPQEDRLRAGILPTASEWADENEDQYGTLYNSESSSILPTEQGGYQRFYSQLAEAINESKPAPVSAEDALWTIKLIHLAMESSRTGLKQVIDTGR